jgi:hypothetical protein
MDPFHQLLAVDSAEWRAAHRRAVASACGAVLQPDVERMAGPDELVALTMPALVRLAVAGVLADGGDSERSRLNAGALAGSAADVLRLLDRALAAHGRDTGYQVEAWLEDATRIAHIEAAAVSTVEVDDMPLGTVIEASADAVGDVVVALHRDRVGVPEGLAHAIGSLLIVYAVGTILQN